jgi:hypothetical protein
VRTFFNQVQSITESFGSVEFLLLLICALAIVVLDYWLRMPF